MKYHHCRCVLCDHINLPGEGEYREFPLPDMCIECYSAVSSALVYSEEEPDSQIKEDINEADIKVETEVQNNPERIRILSSGEKRKALLEVTKEQSSVGDTRIIRDT